MTVWPRYACRYKERDGDVLEAVWSLKTRRETIVDGSSSVMSCMSGRGGEVLDAMGDGEASREDSEEGTRCSTPGIERARLPRGRYDLK